jgi:hypothetical protein
MSEPPPGRNNGADAPRIFSAAGRVWRASLAGQGLAGTGRLSAARLDLVHFFAEGEDVPRFAALLPAGRFSALYDAELAELLARASPVRS